MAERTPKEETAKDDSNQALNIMKKGLHTMKVCQYDAIQVQTELKRELFDNWHEGFEVMQTKGIPLKDIDGFLDHLKDAYEGIDEKMRRKMNGIQWGSEWSDMIIELKPEAENESGAKYGMVVFVKSKDGKSVDCMYCLYKLDFKVAPAKILIKKENSMLWGLVKWETVEEKVQERKLGPELRKRIENFFRYKAVDNFYRQGLIDQINVVPSIEDVVDEK